MANTLRKGKGTFTVVLEGNIGCGKSTLLESLHTNKMVTVLPEPVQKWQNVKGVNLFKLMVEDPKRWAYVFQNYVVSTLLEHHTLRVETPIKIIERSIFSARHCFMKILRENELIHPVEAEIFENWISFVKEKALANVDLGIYVRSSPEVVLQRIKTRGRIEESAITLDYINRLHEKHEHWLTGNAWKDSFQELRIIDGDRGIADVVKQYMSIEEEIKQQW